jgi:hypothetical protein
MHRSVTKHRTKSGSFYHNQSSTEPCLNQTRLGSDSESSSSGSIAFEDASSDTELETSGADSRHDEEDEDEEAHFYSAFEDDHATASAEESDEEEGGFMFQSPVLAAKVDELVDAVFEDALFRICCPRTLGSASPLALLLTRHHQLASLTTGRIELFRGIGLVPSSPPSVPTAAPSSQEPLFVLPLRYTYLDWLKALRAESRIDAGLGGSKKQDNALRPSPWRAAWRFFSHFTIYFVKGLFAGCGIFFTDRYLNAAPISSK